MFQNKRFRQMVWLSLVTVCNMPAMIAYNLRSHQSPGGTDYGGLALKWIQLTLDARHASFELHAGSMVCGQCLVNGWL